MFNNLKSFFQKDKSGHYTPLPSFSSRDSSFEKAFPPPSDSSQFTTISPPSSKWQPDPRTISDATLGLSDGLTVPFALTAGLAALGDTNIVVFAGLAELMAGAISMGVGGYLGASGEAQSAATTKAKTIDMAHNSPAEARAAVISTLERFVSVSLLDAVADDITSSTDKTVAFLLEHQHHMDSDNSSPRLYMSGLTIALGYSLGGFIPLLPYMLFADGAVALFCSVAVMIVTLFVFGAVKTALLGEMKWNVRIWEGVKMILLGGSAAVASVVCIRLVQ